MLSPLNAFIGAVIVLAVVAAVFYFLRRYIKGTATAAARAATIPQGVLDKISAVNPAAAEKLKSADAELVAAITKVMES